MLTPFLALYKENSFKHQKKNKKTFQSFIWMHEHLFLGNDVQFVTATRIVFNYPKLSRNGKLKRQKTLSIAHY